MPSYKLTYFNARGRAEAARLLFAAADVAFDDNRVEFDEWKSKMKAESKFGVLPNLEIDGKNFTQSRAIAYYLAKEFGLYAPDNMGGMQIDEVVFIMEDFSQAFYKARFAPEDKKEEMTKTFMETDLPKYLGWLEKLLSMNGTGYFYGDKITMADIVVFDCLSSLDKNTPGCVSMDKYPGIGALQEKVANNPGIKKYLETRTETQF